MGPACPMRAQVACLRESSTCVCALMLFCSPLCVHDHCPARSEGASAVQITDSPAVPRAPTGLSLFSLRLRPRPLLCIFSSPAPGDREHAAARLIWFYTPRGSPQSSPAPASSSARTDPVTAPPHPRASSYSGSSCLTRRNIYPQSWPPSPSGF